MKRLIKSVLAAMLVSGVSVASAEEVVVIVNANNSQSLTQSDVKAIYSDNIIAWNSGGDIKSFDLPLKNAARSTFSNNLLGVSPKEAAMQWANRKITNTAKNPPESRKETLVVLSVAKYENAIGYVSKSAIAGKDGVRVVMTLK